MRVPLEYIDDYFNKRLTETEELRFEEQCLEDKDFAKDVAFYINAREAVRQKLLEEKVKFWTADEEEIKGMLTISILKKWLPYAAVACMVIVLIFIYWSYSGSPARLADRYVKQEIVSQTMDGFSDSLQRGVVAYSNEDYDKALLIFNKVYKAHPEKSDAKKYAGLVYLVRKDYDKALHQFNELGKRNLRSRPEVLLKAVTYIKRNLEGDKERAKKLLQQVVQQNLEGSNKARELLRELE